MGFEKRGQRGEFRKQGQVWIETVIYTLIGLTIMGLLLGVATPKIREINDRISITQTIDGVMNVIDQKIIEIQSSPGNDRVLNVRIKKGELLIDGANNTIVYTLKGSNYKASEPGYPVKQGNVIMLTTANNGKYDISLLLNYSALDLEYSNKDEAKQITAASVDYSLLMQNLGNNKINFDLI